MVDSKNLVGKGLGEEYGVSGTCKKNLVNFTFQNILHPLEYKKNIFFLGQTPSLS